MKTVIANLEYLTGHLCNGHLELELNNEEFEKFKALPKEEQEEWLNEEGELIVDDYRVDDSGPITDINWYNSPTPYVNFN